MQNPRRPDLRRAARYALPAVVSAVLVVVGYLWKASCVLPGLNLGVADVTSRLCLTDIGGLWVVRDLSSHQFPYIHAVFTPPQGLTGAVEYPVLSGILIWLIGLAATSTLSFLTVNAVILGACAVVVSLLLTRMAGRRAWLWAASPAVLVYVVYNWDTWTVLAATGALAAIAVGTRRTAGPTAGALVVAGVLLGFGGALKVYPLLLLLPLTLLLVHEERGRGSRTARWVGRALIPAGAAGVVLLATNLPLMIINFAGWLTPITFQSQRQLREDTMSIWYWLLRPFGHPEAESIQPAINAVTLTITAIVIVAILVIGWRIAQRRGSYPLLAVSLAIVSADVVFGKVSSPQYLLWLIPLIALVATRVRWVVALYVVDLVMFVSWYQVVSMVTWTDTLGPASGHPDFSRALQFVVAGSVFVRAALIVFISVRALMTDSPVLPRWDRDALPGPRERAAELATEGAAA